jgi:hypothetical protein
MVMSTLTESAVTFALLIVTKAADESARMTNRFGGAMVHRATTLKSWPNASPKLIPATL